MASTKRAAGGSAVRVEHDLRFLFTATPAVSPDGSRIAYANNAYEVVIVNVGGTGAPDRLALRTRFAA